ncbi:MAG: hypothetical protein WBP16_09475 [Ferruginibacter sp.]
MNTVKRYIIALSAVLLTTYLPAQNLTGTWEGDMGTYQFLQLNIIQNGDRICGYSWDHLNYDQESFCKAYFEARFDKKKNRLIIDGTSFFANTGSHTLMQLVLSHKYVNDEPVLFHEPTFFEKLQAVIAQEEVETGIYLKKVSDRPTQILPGMRDCMDKHEIIDDPVINVPEPPADMPEDITIPDPPADTIVKISAPPAIKKDRISIPEELERRKNIEQSHIEVNVKTINLKVYDNAIMDGDTVSILYNGKMLLSHQLLSEKAIEINLELDPRQTRHEITLFAENLGSIPPNTALIVITAGEKRYELFASASLEENAVLVFDYRPKE